MSKRRRPAVDDFFQCYGVKGVSDAGVRRVVAKLRKEPQLANESSPYLKQRFASLDHALLEDTEHGICILQLQVYIDLLCRDAQVARFFATTIVEEQIKEGSVSACFYLDEIVPGNIIAPDNRRRSWCFYFAWLTHVKLRKEILWMPLAILRTELLEQVPGGLPQVMTHILRQCLPFFRGLVIGDRLVITSKLYLLGDEDALKKCLAHKGASGLRPCIRCSNCISKGSSVEGYHSIDHDNFDDFEDVEDQEVLEILQHLCHVEETSTKTKLQEAEKLSGWKRNASVFVLDPELAAIMPPSLFVYDAMHVLWGNGIANQEIGLFWQAATSHIGNADLVAFLNANWEPASLHYRLKCLAGPKLLKTDGSDYKGSCTQTLEFLVLLTYFAHEMLAEIECLSLHIASLTALASLCSKVLDAKVNPNEVAGLRDLQSHHLRCFKACYGEELCRPKHHYGCPLEPQCSKSGCLMDTFPTERKHKVFKQDLAPRIARLQGFERSILIRWIEHDLQAIQDAKLMAWELQQPYKHQPCDAFKFGRRIQCQRNSYKINDLLMFKDDQMYTVYLIVLCFASNKELGLIVQRMQAQSSHHDPLWLCSTWSLLDEMEVMDLEEAGSHIRTSFHSWSEDKSTVVILR